MISFLVTLKSKRFYKQWVKSGAEGGNRFRGPLALAGNRGL